MDPVLQSLIHYQELSLDLSRQKARLEQFPGLIKAIDDDLAVASASLTTARGAVSDHQKDRRQLERELQDLEAKQRKYNDQLMQVKTNIEYKAMQAEISGIKGKVDDAETKILLLMDEAEAADRRVREEERLLDGQKKEAEARKAAIRQEEDLFKQAASQVEAELQAAGAGIGSDVLDLFNRIASTRNGIGVSRARGERCQGCNVRVRPQILQEIRRNARIIQCDSCMRILYYIEESPAPDGTLAPDGTPAADGATAADGTPAPDTTPA